MSTARVAEMPTLTAAGSASAASAAAADAAAYEPPPPRAAYARPVWGWTRFREFARYRLDLGLQHPLSSIVLFLLSIAVNIILGGLLLRALHAAEETPLGEDQLPDDNSSWNWGMAFFNAAHVTADPGGLFDKIRASRGAESFIACLVTLGGMVIFAVLIGGVSEVIAEQHRQLKRGRSKMIEEGHWAILGWNDKLPSIVTQLSMAQSRPREFTVVVVNPDTNMEKEAMDELLDDLNDELEKPLKRILTRTASIHDPVTMRDISIEHARGIILLSCVADPVTDAPSMRALLCVLASLPPVTGPAPSASSPAPVSIVVEVVDSSNIEMLQGLDSRVACVAPRQLLARLLVQTACSHRGLSSVYADLLSFDGSEFHMREWPQLVGQSFEVLQDKFSDSCIVVGIMRASEKPTYPSLANPPPDVVLQHGDLVVVVAEGPDAYGLRDEAPALAAGSAGSAGEVRMGVDVELDESPRSLPAWPDAVKPRAKRILVVGWRADLDDVLFDMNEYVQVGSAVTIIHESPPESRGSKYAPLGSETLPNLTIEHVQAATDQHSQLRRLLLGPAAAASSNSRRAFDAVMVLSDAPPVATLEQAKAADSKILMTTVAIDSLLRSPTYQNGIDASLADAPAAAPAAAAASSSSDQPPADVASPSAPADGQSASSALIPVPAPAPSKGELSAASGSSSIGSALSASSISRVRVVSELSDVHTKDLIQSYDPSLGEFLVSGEIIAMATVQMAYQPQAKLLWDELFTPDGSEVYLKDTRLYVPCGQNVSFRALYRLARQRGELLLGYLHARPAVPPGGETQAHPRPVLNPPNKHLSNIVFQPRDVLIVIADTLH